MRLISMTDFVLNRPFEPKFFEGDELRKEVSKLNVIRKYAEFLKQPLTLGMFVPVDDQGNVLEPLQFCCNGSDCGCMGMPVNVNSQKEIDEYYEAKEKVLFKDAIKIDTTPYKSTKRLLIDLNHQAPFRLFTKLMYYTGKVDEKFLPNFSITATIEYLVPYELELTESAIKQFM